MGSIQPITYPGKKKYILVVLDDFSHIAVVYPMERKDETCHYAETFAESARNLLGRNNKIMLFKTKVLNLQVGTQKNGWKRKELNIKLHLLIIHS